VSSTSPPPLAAGDRLAHYEIVHVLGDGAMGRVYRAHDLGLDRAVAVKVLRPEVAENENTVERFALEARAAARVNHPNLTHVYFVGAQGTHRFFAMELIPGEDLETYVRMNGPVDLSEGIDLLVQIARGMAAAHAAGVVHRDLKPSNIIRRPDGIAKITDFGLAKSMDVDVSQTQAGQVLGTPTYMSPEQCRGEAVDHRADIYALGITAYFLFTGEAPFPGPSVGRVINDQINTPLPRIDAHRNDLPDALQELLDELCEKDADDRPEHMDLVVEMLEGLRPREIDKAPIAARGAAMLIDMAITLVLSLAALFPLQAAGLDPAHIERLFAPAFTIILTLLLLGTELAFGTTYGKWVLELAVRRDDGTRASPRRLMWRYLWRFPAAPIWLLGFFALPVAIDVIAEALGLLAILASIAAYYLTRGLTISDLTTRTRVVYLLPEAKRRARRGRQRRAERREARLARKQARTGVDPASETRIRTPARDPAGTTAGKTTDAESDARPA